MQKKQIAIITTCEDDWGGSEELWGRAVPYWIAAGYDITLYKKNLNAEHPQFVKLAGLGVSLREIIPPPAPPAPPPPKKTILRRVLWRLKILPRPVPPTPQMWFPDEHHYFSHLLGTNMPRLLVISQGINFDGIAAGYVGYIFQLPYVLIAQKAVESFWPNPNKPDREGMRKVYLGARKTYFVSQHNKQLTEEQFAVRFPHAEVISNPVKVPREQVPMPGMESGIKLACIGRYFLLDKGQDILIRIMSKEKWKQRNVTVSFIGSGIDKDALQELAAFLGANNVEFLSQVDNIVDVWRRYHGLVLPSRNEGTPLVLLEAMACGRVAIVSDAGGNGELVADGENGFIGQANEKSFEEALERAWQERHRWEALGKNALNTIMQKIPDEPEKVFAESVLELANTLP
jgi:glycosyltransferase involved in cell wall biosynthesis